LGHLSVNLALKCLAPERALLHSELLASDGVVVRDVRVNVSLRLVVVRRIEDVPLDLLLDLGRPTTAERAARSTAHPRITTLRRDAVRACAGRAGITPAELLAHTFVECGFAVYGRAARAESFLDIRHGESLS